MLPIPLARFYTGSLHHAPADWVPAEGPCFTQGTQAWLSNLGVKYVKLWKTIDQGGGLVQEEEQHFQLRTHTDAAGQGWGETVLRDVRAGISGAEEVRGV